MNTWSEFLATQQIADADPFSARPALIPMTAHRLLQVTGRDALQFLQGQVTCDVRRASQADVLLGAHCNPKGRMLSSFILGAAGPETLVLRLRANLAEAALAHLKKYVVFSKAQMTWSPLVALAIIGRLEAPPFAAVPEVGKSLRAGDTILLRHTPDHLEIWTPETEAPQLWSDLATACTPCSPTRLDLYQAERGIAEVEAATAGEFIPQMFNYHLVDGVSFKKGCYTGQEIIARMQYKGQSKKHTYGVTCGDPLDLPPGSEVAGTTDPQKTLGTVVAGARSANGWRGLIVTTTETRASEPLLLEKKSGAKLAWVELPYAIP